MGDVEKIVAGAWKELPRADRALLKEIRADQWEVCHEGLGSRADAMLRSAGCGKLDRSEAARADEAVGLWIPQLRIVLLNAAHPSLVGLDRASLDLNVKCVAWHEWGHALSIDRAGDDDVARGPEYLALMPPELADAVRKSGYRRREFTHEIVAEIYSILVLRRRLGKAGRPEWLNAKIYELVRRVAGWNQ